MFRGLGKMPKIDWRFWHTSEVGDVPIEVRKILVSQYHLDSQVISKMRYMSKSGSFAGLPVKHIRIFDPALMSSLKDHALRYEDLTRLKGAILFEGHIDKYKHAYLADRRTPKTSARDVMSTGSPMK